MDKIFEATRHILSLPEVASQHGQDVDKLIVYVHYLMGALFIGWIAYFIYVLFRFNRRANPKADYVGIKGHASNYIELIVALCEAFLLLGFAVPLWAKAVGVDNFPTAKDQPTRIKVIAQQFAWNVFYPGKDGEFGETRYDLVTSDNPWGLDKNDPKGKDDFIAPLNEIHVPVGKPVLIML